MSNITASSNASSFAAPWKSAFESHISKQSSPEFVLATLSTDGLPRLRTLIYRGMWATLPPNKHNDCDKNPAAFVSDLPVFTTDKRMEKVPQINASGANIEAMWWITETRTQWRLKGKAHVLGGGDAEDDASRKEVRKKMRATGEGKESDWSWEREFTGHFGNLSPMMRGSFRNPPCGVPKAQFKENADYKQGQKITDLEESVCRSNYRVVVIDPVDVEQLDLTEGEPAKRWLYHYVGQSKPELKEGQELLGEWVKEEVWP